MGILTAILSLFGGSGGIAKQIEAAYEAKLKAANDGERIAADVAISQLSAQQASLVRGGMVSALVQLAFAAPFAIYNVKLIVFDKVLSMGATDPLSPQLYTVESIIVGFYFLRAVFR